MLQLRINLHPTMGPTTWRKRLRRYIGSKLLRSAMRLLDCRPTRKPGDVCAWCELDRRRLKGRSTLADKAAAGRRRLNGRGQA